MIIVNIYYLTHDSKLSREFSRLLNGMNAGGKYHYEFPNDSSDDTGK